MHSRVSSRSGMFPKFCVSVGVFTVENYTSRSNHETLKRTRVYWLASSCSHDRMPTQSSFEFQEC
jgi:hypothetical protein